MYQLHLRVIEATDIPRMDVNATDAYCIITLGGQTRRTRVIKNSMHPRWNEDFHFDTNGNESLRINMKDEDLIKDDPMSYLDIHLGSFVKGQVIDQWYDMIPHRRVKKGGRIHLVIHVAPRGAQPFANTMMQPTMPMMQPTMPMMQPAMPMRPMQPMMPMQPTMPMRPMQPPYPQPAYPQPAYPQPGYPMQPGYPQPAYPQPGYPQPAYPGYYRPY
ncbi:C2 domain containing protein [Histomonas meleagridis]|uniref:C2 domain containing protein n=1 Tax=Histomonas meleagridis TaxID=135588 RepID=UPI003559847E|nr:C2 domain containing protein [Histomonas meleagridis]KAH0797567.1 C2 domain containing protein [Histomonas meleagridis]